MAPANIESIGSYELRHPGGLPPITEDPFHLVDFLIASTEIDSFRSAIDIGCSSGVIPILLAVNTDISHITGVEIDADSARSARENVERNGLDERIEIINSDYRELPGNRSFDIVVSNPPYIKMGHGRKSADDKRMIARYEKFGNLKELIKVSDRLLSDIGRLFLVFPMLRRAELSGELESVNLTAVRVEGLYVDEVSRTQKLFMIEVERGKP